MKTPTLIVDRSPTEATILFEDYDPGDVITLYRAEQYDANFSIIARINTEGIGILSESDVVLSDTQYVLSKGTYLDRYIDTGLVPAKNYKYKASLGDPVGLGVLSMSTEVLSSSQKVLSDGALDEGQRSQSIYTKGQ